MESLLSLSFSNISSRDAVKIRKGLRQIEGLLAQICLSSIKGGSNRRTSVVDILPTTCKKIDELVEDPAFYEFFRLQDGFEWNVTTHLITCLERLLSMHSNTANDTLLLSALNLLQGMLLLHPPSRALFSREIYMNLLLDLLPPSLPPSIQSATLIVLVIALLDNPQNVRVFEAADGLLAVSALLQDPDTTRMVRSKVLEFLYFYLLPERDISPAGSYSTDTARKIPTTGSGSSADLSLTDFDERCILRTGREKQRLLGRHIESIGELMAEFEESRIFEGAGG
ncbi:cell division control protein [Microthyrium microscopicum]|uniref:Cell division control protein n=1 Tax=Microthyrium microscopicum TaxID=703497 RepID=A0A6A6TZN0_9PEZI|nr:cell division control protein [Microthyrium microscopicum]